MSDPDSAAIPASTLVVLRDRAGAPPEVLMVERSNAMAFAAGALVFPGGRIDPQDHALAARLGLGEDAAARIAAIRETIEEAGLALGLLPPPPPAALAAMRAGLHAGTPFAALLDQAGLALDLDALVPFARWRPPHREALARVFDTRFYLARLPEGAPEPSVDATENSRLIRASAAAILAQAATGLVRLVYPTRRNLERLAGFGSFAAAVADAARHPVRIVVPWIEARDGVDHLCIDDDLGYPVTAEALAGALRG